MRFRPLPVTVLLALGAASLAAATADETSPRRIQDVGDGLLYARVTRAPAEIPTPEELAGRSVILDVRFAADDGTADGPLTTLIRAVAGATRPVFILTNADTSPRLQQTVSALDPLPGVITVASARENRPADFVVLATSDDERAAYAAFATGKSVVELTTDLPEKRRHDEASLTRQPPAEEPEADGTAGDDLPPPRPDVVRKPKPVIDAALQRAVHLYRGLRALQAL